MKSKINEILKQIEEKYKELAEAYNELKEKYFYELKWKKVFFDKKRREYNKKYKVNVFSYFLNPNFKYILSMPFIYWMAIPVLFLDIWLFIYKNICFRLYWIPLVKRKDYIFYDRRYLDYLNILQKFNCVYCSRVNWLFSYAVEIAWRTEQYWCPIKASRKIHWWHDWQKTFADYWDPEWFKECFNNNKIFKK